MPKRRKMSVEQELEAAFGQSLLEALSAAYLEWRHANGGKCSAREVGSALIFFLGGSLAEMGVASQLPAKGKWELFIRDSQRSLAEAMAFCRGHLERQ
jgi:hypothetical protein